MDKARATMSRVPLVLLRYVSLAEGVAFLVLLYFAIYHKSVLGDEEAIRVPEMVHSVPFRSAPGHVWIDRKWSIGKWLSPSFVQC